MPEVIKTTVYRLDELPPGAKETARQWYREGAFDHNWHDAVFEDFKQIGEILGLSFKVYQVPLMNGQTREEPRIWFSGFASQGDGACFEAIYDYARGASRKIRGYAALDQQLHRIADELQEVQRRNFYQLRADISHVGRYYHEYTMRISVERRDDPARDLTEGAEETVTELMRDLARWLYRQLKREYEYLNSDEAVDEAILAGDYTFTRDGERFG